MVVTRTERRTGFLTAACPTFPTVVGRAAAALEEAGKVTGKAAATGWARSPPSYAAPSPKSPSDRPGKKRDAIRIKRKAGNGSLTPKPRPGFFDIGSSEDRRRRDLR